MSGYENKYTGDYKSQVVEQTHPNHSFQSSAMPPKKSKFKEHFRRYWWLHLISFIIGTILVTLLLIFVGMPNIAQNGINDAELTLQSQVVSDPTPSSVKINMVTVSKSKSPFHPWLDEMKAALFLEDTLPNIKPFGYITIPRLKATATALITVDQTLEIADQDQFAAYNLRVMQSESYRVAIRARTGLREASFPKTTINFNKVITSKGLNSLKGLQVRNITISLVPEKDGSNMKGLVYIPNPAPMTIQLGTVTQDVYVDGKKIGVATIPNLQLKPGDNLVPMTSVSDQAAVIGLITTKYPTGDIPVTIIGNSSIFNGQRLPYFEKALQATQLQTTLVLGPALKAIGLDVTKLGGAGGGSSSSSSSGPAPPSSPSPSVSPPSAPLSTARPVAAPSAVPSAAASIAAPIPSAIPPPTGPSPSTAALPAAAAVVPPKAPSSP